LALRYIVRCTSDSGRGPLQMKRKWVVNRLIYQLVEAGIDNLDIVVDDVASLPIHQASVSQIIFTFKAVFYTSASRFQSLFTSGACSLHCSPMILDISGLASPGCWATTCAW
jgi:hypothetical protein